MKPCSSEGKERIEVTPSAMGDWLLAVVASVLIVANSFQLARFYHIGHDRSHGKPSPAVVAAQPPPLMAFARPMPPEEPRPLWQRGLGVGVVSPDGNWELFQMLGRHLGCNIFTRDGSRPRRVRSAEFSAAASNALWLPDSRSWVQVAPGKKGLYAVIERLDAAAPVRTIPLGYPRWTFTNWDLIASKLLGFTGADRVLALPGGAQGQRHQGRAKAPFFEFSLRSARSHLREYEITLPEGLEFGEDVVLSPGSDRLAWFLYVGTREPEGLPSDARGVQLAISHVDGSGMHVIGALPKEAEELCHWHRRLVWLPDGKRVSFYHGGSRWSVPVTR